MADSCCCGPTTSYSCSRAQHISIMVTLQGLVQLQWPKATTAGNLLVAVVGTSGDDSGITQAAPWLLAKSCKSNQALPAPSSVSIQDQNQKKIIALQAGQQLAVQNGGNLKGNISLVTVTPQPAALNIKAGDSLVVVDVASNAVLQNMEFGPTTLNVRQEPAPAAPKVEIYYIQAAAARNGAETFTFAQHPSRAWLELIEYNNLDGTFDNAACDSGIDAVPDTGYTTTQFVQEVQVGGIYFDSSPLAFSNPTDKFVFVDQIKSADIKAAPPVPPCTFGFVQQTRSFPQLPDLNGNITSTWDAPTTAGNLLIAIVGLVTPGNVAVISAPEPWQVTQPFTPAQQQNVVVKMHYITNAASQRGGITFGIGDPNCTCWLRLLEYAAPAGGGYFDFTAATSGNGVLLDSDKLLVPTTAPLNIAAFAYFEGQAAFANPTNGYNIRSQLTQLDGTFVGAVCDNFPLVANNGQCQITATPVQGSQSGWSGTVATFGCFNPAAPANTPGTYYGCVLDRLTVAGDGAKNRAGTVVKSNPPTERPWAGAVATWKCAGGAGSPCTGAYVQKASNVGQVVAPGGGTFSATWKAATATGSMLVAVVGIDNSTTITATPANWVLAVQSQTNAGQASPLSVSIYYIANAASRNGAESFTFNKPATIWIEVIEYNNPGGGFLSLVASNSGNGSELDSGTTQKKTVATAIDIAAFQYDYNDGQFTAPSRGFKFVDQLQYNGVTPAQTLGAVCDRFQNVLDAANCQIDATANVGPDSWAGAVATFGCDISPPIPVNCCSCTVMPTQWQVTFVGMTNTGCVAGPHDCTTGNKTYVLTYTSGCNWKYTLPVGDVCGCIELDFACNGPLGVPPNNWLLTFGSVCIGWRVAQGSFDCLNGGTLTLYNTTSCNGPATVTIAPAKP